MTSFPDLTGKRGKKRSTKPRAYSLYEEDAELIKFIATYFGCSNSEAVRTAVRSFAANLEALSLLRLATSKD